MTDQEMMPSGNLSDPFAGMSIASQSQAPPLQLKRPPPLFNSSADQNDAPNDVDVPVSQMGYLATPDFITPQEFQLEYQPANRDLKNHRTPVQLSPNRAKRHRGADLVDGDIEISLSQMGAMPPAAFTGRQGVAGMAPLAHRPPIGRARSPPCYRNIFSDAQSEVEVYADWKVSTSRPDTMTRFKAEFKQVGVLGHGNYSKAFHVRHRLDGCEYAVKRSLSPVATDTEQFEQFLKEVQVYANVPPHPHIVRYYSSWLEPSNDGRNSLYLQLEKCDLSLETHANLCKNEISTSETLDILQQMCLALAHLHAHGTAHLDIKPDNIYLSCPSNDSNAEHDKPLYKLGDFGQATRLGSKSVEEGDRQYLPLEIMNGDYSRLDKADMFSLGATLYQILSRGHLPESGRAFEDVRSGKFPILVGAPAPLYNMVKKLMSRNPADRPSAGAVLKSSLFVKKDLPAVGAVPSSSVAAAAKPAVNDTVAGHQQPAVPRFGGLTFIKAPAAQA